MLWVARVAWVLQPIAAGSALADALDGWSSAPATLAAALLWIAWAAGLLALFAPRPWGITILRVVAPAAAGVTIATAFSADGGEATLAIATSVVAAVTALSSPVMHAAADRLTYGTERRFPLRVPLSLALGPLPLAVALVVAGIATGPLLLADGRIVAGVIVTALGVPLAAVLVRSLSALDRRWVVLVPAGLVVADPLVLIDPVLMPRATVERISRRRDLVIPALTLDLRLGTLPGTVEIRLHEPATFGRHRRRRATMVEAPGILVAPLRPDALLAAAAERRLPVA